ncbi:hypothetical protein Tco_0867096 [Tanacetum coccineum]
MPEDIKVPLILGIPFFSTARAKIDVYKRKITLRVGEENIIFKSVKPASSLIKRVYMLSLRERMELDLEARLIGETLVLNRSLDPFLEDYIELNDLNEPFELRRNQGDDLMPTIEEGEVIEEFRTRDDELDTKIDDYPSYCDSDKKIHIDCAHNLKFSCMIGFEFTHANFFPLLYVNVMSKKFHNSIMKDKMVYKGNNVVGALMNVSIFVGTFSVVSEFAVLEDMDDYRDEGMGDVIFGEPFLREVGIKTKWFKGIITIYNVDDEVTYQMVRSHQRPIRRIHQGRYGVSVPAFTKDHKGIKLNTPYPEDQYAVLEIWNEYNILEDIKRGPYSKKSPIRPIMARSTIEHGGTSGSVCGPEDESNVESSHARRRSSFINQAPHDPSKRPMITLDGGGFADTKVSRTITTIFKNMFNGSWTTWKEVTEEQQNGWPIIRNGLVAASSLLAAGIKVNAAVTTAERLQLLKEFLLSKG